MAFLIPFIPAAGGAGAAIAGYFGAKTIATACAMVATKTAQLAVVWFGGELLSKTCVRSIKSYEEFCKSFYDDIQCIIKKSSVITACGGELASNIFSGKIICDTVFPGKCNLTGK